MFGIPAIGLVCLVIGLVQRSRSRPRPSPYPPPYGAPAPVAPGYPYPPSPPMGYPGPPYPGYPPPWPPRRRTGQSGTALIIIGALLLVLGGMGILGNLARVLFEHGGNSLLEVGDCISESDYAAHHFDAHASGGCTYPAATYELAFKGGASDSCPDGEREHSIYERTSNHSTTLCFIINLQQGRCYLFISDGEAVSFKPGDCGNPNGVKVKVAQRIDGSTDKAQCPAGTKGIGYPTPPRVYCLEKADS